MILIYIYIFSNEQIIDLATVITNLMSAIPWIGQDIVEYIWGGFSVNNATLNRFFALHFVLPFVLTALVLMHLVALHDSAGSSTPLGVSGNYDRLPFSPYFIFKDLITIFLFMLILSLFVFFMPNVLGDSENYVMADPMKTPAAIVPEWYLLPFYAILRSIPNKLLGVIAMFFAILILLLMPFLDISKLKGTQFKPFNKFIYFLFISNFLILMVLGAKHVENPFIELGQNSTILYFVYFLIIIPIISLIENFSFKILDFNLINFKNSKKLVTNTNYVDKLLNKFYLNHLIIYNNYVNKFMLFSATILSNGTMIITIVNPKDILDYFKSVIPKIKIPKSDINTNTDILQNNLWDHNSLTSNFIHNSYMSTNCFKNNWYSIKDFSNIDVYIYNMSNYYNNIIWTDIINIYYNNKPIFTCFLTFILYKIILELTSHNNIIHNTNLTNIFVYYNRNNITLTELQDQLSSVINESNRLLSQLNNFIDRFNSFIAENNINIITDAQGNMSMDVPYNIDDNTVAIHTNRVHTLDSLIRNHINTLERLINRGNSLENNILDIDSSYNVQIEYINNRLNNLKNNYKHT